MEAVHMADLGNTAVISPTDSSNASGTMPSWNGSASPNTIDDAGRALNGAIAREWECRSFPASTGTAPSFVVTYTVAPAAIRSGQTYTLTAHAAAAGTDTVNINSLGAKTIKKIVAGTKTNLSANDFYANDKLMLEYDGTDLVWVNWPGSSSSAYTVNAQTEETAPAKGDFVGGYDISGTAERKFTIENVLEVVNDLTEDTSPDTANDFVLTYDASASGVKKVKPNNLSSGLTLATPQASTSGTTIDFTSIPSGVKRIDVLLSGISYTGSATDWIIQIGDSGGIETTGYVSTGIELDATPTIETSTQGFNIGTGSAQTSAYSGVVSLFLLDSSSNLWVANGALQKDDGTSLNTCTGTKSLSATLDRVRVTTAAGRDFDAGSINIQYQ